MSAINWTHFTTRIPVRSAPEEIYRCWATREGLEFWFLRQSEWAKPDGSLRSSNELVQKGDRYTWRWHGWPDDTVEYGEILDCNGKDRLSFSFGKAGICVVTIQQEEGEVIVQLEQTAIPDDEYGKQHWHVGCKTGWTFYLANLKSLLEGGIDLRNRNEKLKNVINS